LLFAFVISLEVKMKGNNIVIGITGGIACYKMCEVVSGLKKAGAGVDVVMTKNATQFVAPLTFETLSQRPVTVDMFAKKKRFDVEHVALAQKADGLVIAPATANIIGKLACGIADDMLSTTVLAAKCPIIIAPAMNTAMLESKAVRENLQTLASRGYIILPCGEGRLACGDTGKGKMCEPQVILDKIAEILSAKQDLRGKKILVTAGATIQKIDGVRFISNFSSGKMGCEIAKNALERGADVILVLGSHTVEPPPGARVVSVQTTDDMFKAVIGNMGDCDLIVKAAAPCDYSPETITAGKIKSRSLDLKLSKTVDIAAEVGKIKGGKTLIVFAAETENLIENARKKLIVKNADFVIANDVTLEGAGFNCDTNIGTVIDKNGSITELPKLTKAALAVKILDLFSAQ